MKSKYQKIKGTFDILPPETEVWQHIESTIHSICQQFSFQEIRTPAMESVDLFKRNIGDETDVSKEMFVWEDQSGKEISLKPEMTAPVVRAYIESGFFRKHPRKHVAERCLPIQYNTERLKTKMLKLTPSTIWSNP